MRMLSRALSLATVMLLIGCCAADRVQAQENLEAGKSPSQIFAGACTACHKAPRGLLKTVPPGSLPSFLRQHYTTSPNMAGVLATYLISNGATDTRSGGAEPKGAKNGVKEGARDGKPESKPEQAGSPENEGRNAKRLARPAEKPEPDAHAPSALEGEHGPEGGKASAKQRLSKRSKPGAEEPPKGV